MKLPRNWAALRKAALKRAGWRSQRSGLAGRLEVHHKRGRAYNGAGDLEVLTRSEHLLEHKHPDPGREVWAVYLEEQINA